MEEMQVEVHFNCRALVGQAGSYLLYLREHTLAWCHHEEFKDRAIDKALDSMKEMRSSRALFYFIHKGW